MGTVILTILIGLGVIYGLRSFIKGKGTCGDCTCSCPIKNEMQQSQGKK